MGRNSASPQVKLSLLPSISLKIELQGCSVRNRRAPYYAELSAALRCELQYFYKNFSIILLKKPTIALPINPFLGSTGQLK
jgi:hypothetical protein